MFTSTINDLMEFMYYIKSIFIFKKTDISWKITEIFKVLNTRQGLL